MTLARTLLSAALLAASLSAAAEPSPAPAASAAHLERARALLRRTPLFDGHNDLPWVIRSDKKAPRNVEASDLRQRSPGDTDLPRLRQGGVGGQFWSVYVPANLKGGFTRYQLEQIDIARRVIARYPEALELATRASDFAAVTRRGRIASYLGIEGGHVIENSLGALRAFYDLGVRYMTLTHSETLDWVDAAGKPRHGGLTRFGDEVVREMNRLGMLVDLSHVSPESMRDALAVTEAPIIFSHSSCLAICDHRRNVPDDVLKRLSQNGGIVMITFVPSFVSQEVAAWTAPLRALTAGMDDEASQKAEEAYKLAHPPVPRATLRQVADHIDHARKVAGVDHVGIGADYYGSDDVTLGLEDVSRYPHLFAELMRRGWTDADLAKLASGNIVRVMGQAETVAARMQRSRPPSNATIEELDGAKAK